MEKLDKLYVVKANDNIIYYYAQRPDVKFNEKTNEFDIIPQNNVDPIAAHEDIDSESGLQPCKVYELTSDGLDAETSTAKVKPAPLLKNQKTVMIKNNVYMVKTAQCHAHFVQQPVKSDIKIFWNVE